jgi:DNA-directed RNA polymerase subunit F
MTMTEPDQIETLVREIMALFDEYRNRVNAIIAQIAEMEPYSREDFVNMLKRFLNYPKERIRKQIQSNCNDHLEITANTPILEAMA